MHLRPGRRTWRTRRRCRTRRAWSSAACATRRSTGACCASSTRAASRVESHGIAHRPLAEVSLDEAVREIAVSKLKLEEQLGRPGARVSPTSRARRRTSTRCTSASLKQAGYEIALHVDLARERPAHEPVPARPLQRRAVPGAHVRARARGRVRPDRAEGHRRRHACPPPVQPGARHRRPGDAVDRGVRPVAARATLADADGARLGRARRTRPSSAWFYERNPVRPASVLLGEEDGKVVGDGGDELPAHVDRRRGGRGRHAASRLATDPAYQRPRHLREAAGGERGARARGWGSRLLLIVPNAASAPIFLEAASAGGAAVAAGLGAAAAAARAACARRRVERFEHAMDLRARGDRVLRDAAWLTGASRTRRATTSCSHGDGYAVGRAPRPGRGRRRASTATCSATRAPSRPGRSLVAAPPPWERAALRPSAASCRRRATFTLLGKSLGQRRAAGAAALRARRPRLPVSAARLRHAAGRPGAPGARRRPCRRSARSRRASTRSPCSRRTPSTACCRTNCRVRVFGSDSQRRARPALRGGAQRASSSARPRRGRSRTWRRSTRSSPRRSRGRARVPLLLWFTHWKPTRTLAARRAALDRGAHASTAARSRSRSGEGRARSGTGSTSRAFACVEREPGGRLRAVALGRTSPAKGLETIVRAAALADVELELRGPSLDRRGARRAAAARGARRPARGAGAVRRRPRRCSRSKDVLVNNMREGALDKVVYEAAATCMPVLASNTRLRRPAPARAPLRPRRRRRPGRRSSRAPRRTPTANALGRELRERVEARPLRRALGRRGARGGARCDDRPARRRRSPASRAPRRTCSRCCRELKRARLGHPLPDAARARARRVGVRARARGRRRAGRRDPDARRRRPGHVRARARLPAHAPADDPAHAPRARRRLRPDGRDARAACRCGSRPSTASTSSARAALFALGDRDDRRARAPADRDLARPRALPRPRPRASAEPDFEIVHYGIAAGPEPRAVRGRRRRASSASAG